MKQEIRIGFCRADLVAFKDNKVCAIELKLKYCKKALIQAQNYQLAADYVYLAVPLMNVYSIIRKAEPLLQKHGIGILTVNELTGKVNPLLPAHLSKRKLGTLTTHSPNQPKIKWKSR